MMTNAQLDAMIAGAYNICVGSKEKGEPMTPAKAAKLSRQNRVALLHMLKSSNDESFYSNAEVESGFAMAVNQ